MVSPQKTFQNRHHYYHDHHDDHHDHDHNHDPCHHHHHHILVNELIIDGLLNEKPSSCNTVLPLVEENTAKGVLHCLKIFITRMVLLMNMMMVLLMLLMMKMMMIFDWPSPCHNQQRRWGGIFRQAQGKPSLGLSPRKICAHDHSHHDDDSDSNVMVNNDSDDDSVTSW